MMFDSCWKMKSGSYHLALNTTKPSITADCEFCNACYGRIASEYVSFRLVSGPSVVDGLIIAAITIDSVAVFRESLRVNGPMIAASVDCNSHGRLQLCDLVESFEPANLIIFGGAVARLLRVVMPRYSNSFDVNRFP